MDSFFVSALETERSAVGFRKNRSISPEPVFLVQKDKNKIIGMKTVANQIFPENPDAHFAKKGYRGFLGLFKLPDGLFQIQIVLRRDLFAYGCDPPFRGSLTVE